MAAKPQHLYSKLGKWPTPHTNMSSRLDIHKTLSQNKPICPIMHKLLQIKCDIGRNELDLQPLILSHVYALTSVMPWEYQTSDVL